LARNIAEDANAILSLHKMFCECCGMQLRASPHCGRVYKEKVRVYKKKLIAVL
jgi:hypothetical protein